jgi:hypothetical protein
MKIKQCDFSVEQLFKLVEQNLLSYTPNRSIWDKKEIKQFLHLVKINIPLPPFYITINDIGDYTVLDILNGVRRFDALLTEKDTTDLKLLSVHFRVNILLNPTTEEIQLLKNILG